MGRLFWKFFLATFVTLCLSAMAVVLGMHAYHTRSGQESDFEHGPKARFEVQLCAFLLERSGHTALQEFLLQHSDCEVLVVDRAGHELLGREISAEQLQRVRSYFQQTELPDSVMKRSVNGTDYLLFSVSQRLMEGVGRLPMPPVPEGPGSFVRPRMERPEEPDDIPPQSDGPPPHLRPTFFFHPPLLEPLIITVLASLCLSVLLAWYLSRPIKVLRGALTAVGEGRLDTRVGAVSARNDEIGELGRDFDLMVQRVALLVNAQQRLLHDVSHELRSPLARLQVATGLLRKEPSLLESGLDRIELESTRLDALIGEILTLSRIECGMQTMPHEEVNIEELLQGIIEDAQFEAERIGVQVRLVHSEKVMAMVQPELIRRAIENVVRNGLKFTPREQTLAIELLKSGCQCCIRVLDTGPGLAESELEAIFNPFYQSSAGKTDNGYGLGLTIARRAVLGHGGTIVAENRPTGGLCVEIRLPVC